MVPQSPRPDVFLVGLDEIADRIPGALKTAFPVRAGAGHQVDIRRGRRSLAGANVHSEGVESPPYPTRAALTRSLTPAAQLR